MHQKSDGMNYAPVGKANRVVGKGEFRFAVTGLDHGHIHGMLQGLIEAGAECVGVWDGNEVNLTAFHKRYPDIPVAENLEALLEDRSINMIAAAAIPYKRCELGLKVMEHGKDYFCDKAPMTTLEQVDAAEASCRKTGMKYAVYYSERLHVEGAVLAGQLIKEGAIGEVVQVTCLAPHRLSPASRPDWFWSLKESGGTLCDIGSHQIEQFLYYTGCDKAQVLHAERANYTQPEHPEFDDFGSATLLSATGATQYFKLDWLTPDGLGAWGDGRLFVLGTKGYIEVRKYLDVARDTVGDQVYIVDGQSERHIPANGTVGYPFFGQLILDSLNRTSNAMTQEHAFAAARLGIEAQQKAVRIYSAGDKQ